MGCIDPYDSSIRMVTMGSFVHSLITDLLIFPTGVRLTVPGAQGMALEDIWGASKSGVP